MKKLILNQTARHSAVPCLITWLNFQVCLTCFVARVPRDHIRLLKLISGVVSIYYSRLTQNKDGNKTSLNLILAIVHKTKKAKKLCYTGDDPKINILCNVQDLKSWRSQQKTRLIHKNNFDRENVCSSRLIAGYPTAGFDILIYLVQKQNNKMQY